jgi:hypothetical protein
MTTNIPFLPNDAGAYTLLIQPGSKPKSLLTNLTTEEVAALNQWSAVQPGDPQRAGVVDMMQWPGWEEVMARRFKDRFGASMPKSGD